MAIRIVAMGNGFRRELRGKTVPLGDKEPVCDDAESGVVMESRQPRPSRWPSPVPVSVLPGGQRFNQLKFVGRWLSVMEGNCRHRAAVLLSFVVTRIYLA